MAASPTIRTDAGPYQGPPPPERLHVRFPRLASYLAALPEGIRSYPQCQARSGILQTFLDAGPQLDDGLDPFVAQLLLPPARGFIPEVCLNAAFLGVADATGMTDAQFCAWNRSANAQLFQGLIFRALMSVFSPMVLLERAPARWESFHGGSLLTVRKDGPKGAIGELSFPARLFTPLLLAGIAECYAAAFEHARGREVTVELAAHGPTAATFQARWS